ncbi:hypothetical protein [Micromonospora coerulea]|uniref:hypothetical protein n=1 Tax=Micromonospora coerulea TaxID=47856 RepID=UPI0031F8E7F2
MPPTGFYRAWDATLAEHEQRKNLTLGLPVLAIGGAASWAGRAAEGRRPGADDVQAASRGAGHWSLSRLPTCWPR